ncbi:hypothetical protein Tco_0688917 [Tanacetum coccineum]
MSLCTKLQKHVLDLEEAKTAPSKTISWRKAHSRLLKAKGNSSLKTCRIISQLATENDIPPNIQEPKSYKEGLNLLSQDEELALNCESEEQAELEKERVAQEEASRAAENIRRIWRIVSSFIHMDSEVVKSSVKRTEGSSKRAGDELDSDKSKKQKIDEHVEAEKDD